MNRSDVAFIIGMLGLCLGLLIGLSIEMSQVLKLLHQLAKP